ncbi:hypothetical protein B0T25DRAFT_528643, partial [Lasiosphaeria hispida]
MALCDAGIIDLVLSDDPEPSAMPPRTLNAALAHRLPWHNMPKQIFDVINIPDDDLPSSLLDRPSIVSHKGKAYILEKWEHCKRPRGSWVGAHGCWLIQVENNKLGDSFRCCSLCPNIVYNG